MHIRRAVALISMANSAEFVARCRVVMPAALAEGAAAEDASARVGIAASIQSETLVNLQLKLCVDIEARDRENGDVLAVDPEEDKANASCAAHTIKGNVSCTTHRGRRFGPTHSQMGIWRGWIADDRQCKLIQTEIGVTRRIARVKVGEPSVVARRDAIHG